MCVPSHSSKTTRMDPIQGDLVPRLLYCLLFSLFRFFLVWDSLLEVRSTRPVN